MYPASLKNIVIENNFLDKKKINAILDILKNTSSKEIVIINDPNDGGADNKKDGSPVSLEYFLFDDSNTTVLNSFILKLKQYVEYTFGQRFYLATPIWGRAWQVGDFLSVHSDGEYNNSDLKFNDTFAEEEWANHIPGFLCDYSSLLYLNDDYEGGELFFPEFDLTIKPKLGDLITFPTNSMYLHAVKEVKCGTRYTIQLSWFRKTTLIANTLPKNNAILEAVKGFGE